jgi:(p)ppGpp synthase/HD superfamily hydrolase
MSSIEAAITLACKAHQGQIDKGGSPYILHPLRLMLRMSRAAELMAAVMHDVVEDGDVSLQDLRSLSFPESVVSAVDCLTRRKGEDYEGFLKRLAVNPLARRVKMEDLKDNMNLTRLSDVTDKDLKRQEKHKKALQILAELEQTV